MAGVPWPLQQLASTFITALLLQRDSDKASFERSNLPRADSSLKWLSVCLGERCGQSRLILIVMGYLFPQSQQLFGEKKTQKQTNTNKPLKRKRTGDVTNPSLAVLLCKQLQPSRSAGQPQPCPHISSLILHWAKAQSTFDLAAGAVEISSITNQEDNDFMSASRVLLPPECATAKAGVALDSSLWLWGNQ